MVAVFSFRLSTAMMRWCSSENKSQKSKAILFTTYSTAFVVLILINSLLQPFTKSLSNLFFGITDYQNYFLVLILSASFEILIGKILSVLYNDDKIDSVELAKIGQKAENNFLGKPCGLMDQVACSYGGIVSIDFNKPEDPSIELINYSFEDKGYKLLVIDTGGDHADLTEDYAAIPFLELCIGVTHLETHLGTRLETHIYRMSNND